MRGWARQLRSELRLVTDVPARELRAEADELARDYRELDVRIQEADWTTELSAFGHRAMAKRSSGSWEERARSRSSLMLRPSTLGATTATIDRGNARCRCAPAWRRRR